MSAIDVHAHIIPLSAIKACDEGRDWFGSRFTRKPVKGWTLSTGDVKVEMRTTEYWGPHKTRLPYMDEDQLDIQVLSLNPQLIRDQFDKSVAIPCSQIINDELGEAVSEHPTRFRGLASLPLQDTDASLRELDRAMSKLQLSGFLIATHVDGTLWDDPRLFPILEEAERRGAFILMHPFNNRLTKLMPRYHMVNVVGNPLETTMAAGSMILGGVLDRLPNLKICLSHAGGYLPFAVGRFDHAYQNRTDTRENAGKLPSSYLRRFYYDCISHNPVGFQQAVEMVGADRFMIGTDFPADMELRSPVKWIRQHEFLSRGEADAIIGGNAERLGLRRLPN